MSFLKLNSFTGNFQHTSSIITCRFYTSKLHHLKTKKSVATRIKLVPQGPTKPIIPNTEVEPPKFKIMTKYTGVQHGIAKKEARRTSDKRGYREPNKLVKKYIKSFVHDKNIRKLIDW